MGKLVWLALVVALGCKALAGRWPWELWRAWTALPPAPVAAARRLLGLAPGAGRDEILAAHRLLITRVHPDRGGSAEQVHQADAARDLLLAGLDKPG
ncbi:MAG: molecular chaperone DnaJ [Proteobacteria bacterium]|nr:molecular chaperone DnaJ [Pseudomonadota bacterium]